MLKITDTKRLKMTWRFLKKKCGEYFSISKKYKEFKALSVRSGNRFSVEWQDVFFLSGEDTATTGFNIPYVYHTGWAARVLARTRPSVHYDISSWLAFTSITSAFIPIKFYDFRPANLKLSNIATGKADLTSLPFANNSIGSISCMHTIEHIGLGRYGDPVDPNGDLKAIRELIRVTKKGGDLLFVVPVGKPKICFNSHRTYSYAQIMEYFKDLELKEFFLIPDDAIALKEGPIENATEEDADRQTLGCGCFWFRKTN